MASFARFSVHYECYQVGGTTGYLPCELDGFITLWLLFWVMHAF